MHARLELELAVRALTDDAEDDLLEAALLRVALRQDLDLPAMTLGVARVHPVEIEREERCLFSTFAGADLDDDVLLVERIARHELGAKSCDALVDLPRRGCHVFAVDVA